MLTDVFDNAGIEYHVYDKTVANPTTDTVEEALAIYKDNKCDCIIGFGGGSSMDCAKAVGVRIARPKTHLSKLGGILKVHAKLPLLVANSYNSRNWKMKLLLQP
ncbi:MAG: iron-containing alcohol dehydrogenase [Lachnospira eligens]